MTTTWAELLADVRSELDDAVSPYEWSGDALYTWFKDARADYSTYNPITNSEVLTETAAASYACPEDYLTDLYVEVPEGTFLKKRHIRPGVRYISKATPYYYWITGSTLYISADTDEDVTLTYQALHPKPSSVEDTDFELTIPERDEELIRLYMKAKAYEKVRSGQSSLDRFKLGSGDRDDNPLRPETDNLMEEYRLKMYERYGGGVIKLYRQ